MSAESYALRSWWGCRQETGSSCAKRLARTVTRLAEIDKVFGSWDVVEIPADEAEVVQLFEKNRSYYDFSSDKIFPELGFKVQISNMLTKPDAALIDMRVGAYFERKSNPHINNFSIVLSNRRLQSGREWAAGDLRRIMLIVIEEWDVHEASIDCFRYQENRRQFSDSNGQKRFFFPWEGWITFVPWPEASLIVAPEGTDIERLSNGGALFTLCEEPFTIDNPRHMALAADMQRALEPIQKA